MFCSKCGKELETNARFCAHCGTPVDGIDADTADASQKTVKMPAVASTTVKPEPDKASEGAEKAASKISIAAIVAVIAAALALAAALGLSLCSRQQSEPVTSSASSLETLESAMSSAASSSESSSTEEDASASSESSEDAEQEEAKELTPEEAFIKSLNGWWSHGARQGVYGDNLSYVHDGTMDTYTGSGEFVQTYRTIEPAEVARFDNGLGSTGIMGPGWFIYGANGSESGMYVSDAQPDAISFIHLDGTGYSGGDTLGRTDPPEWAESVVGTSNNDASSAKTSKTEPFDQAKAEADARAAAKAAGKQILTGRVVIQDENTRASELGFSATPTGGLNPAYAFLLLDAPQTVTARSASGWSNPSLPNYHTAEGVENVLLARDAGCDAWRNYEGQTITIACTQDELSTFSDAVGALFNVSAESSAEVIAPLTEEEAKAKEAASSPDAYVLADSATKAYSRSELEALDNHTLFLARNEIYARHGRGFKNQELRDYFAGKAWYKETASPESFNDNVLNEAEKANANLMLEIEKSRNSPYLG